MKKYFLLLIPALLLSISFIACDDDSTGPDPANTGTLIITSTPSGATVFIDGTQRGTTNDTIPNVTAGTRSVRLSLQGYRDTTVSVVIVENQQTLRHVQLTQSVVPPTLTKHIDKRIWETTGTTASQPSGLDLSAGEPKSSSDPTIDLYYFSSGSTYEIRSSQTRNTSFLVGTSSNLEDTLDSPLVTNAWLNKVSDREANYFFIYDADGHYSKAIITGFGGGSGNPNDPAWLELTWYYNETPNDHRFGDNN